MGADQHFDWRASAASALEWWHDAGVETLVDERARDWHAAPAPPRSVARAAAVAATAAPPVSAPTVSAPTVSAPLPGSLAHFAAWRVGPDAPEAAWPGTVAGAMIAASGDPGASIMVLADMCEREDAESGALLGGAAGRLFDRMLAAIGRTRDDVYLASVCAVRPTAGRVPPQHEGRLTEIARHHVALVAPKRLLLLGNAPSRALIGADVARVPRGLQSINLESGEVRTTVAAVASFHPRLLLERPTDKARAWKDLQMLVAGLDA